MNVLVPVEFNHNLASLICESLANGKALNRICRMPGFPSFATLIQWKRETPAFAEALAIANKAKADLLMEEAIDIADDDSGDWREVQHKNGNVSLVFDHEHPSRSKLKVDVRKWVAQRLDREQYGDVKQLDIEAKVLTVHLTDEQLDNKLAQFNSKLIDITRS